MCLVQYESFVTEHPELVKVNVSASRVVYVPLREWVRHVEVFVRRTIFDVDKEHH